MSLDRDTLLTLKYASTIITDKAVNFDEVMKLLRREIVHDENKWKQCTRTRFVVLSGDDDLGRLQAIIASDSLVKNEDTESRAYFLGQLLKHLDASLWDKVSKEQFRKRYADYDESRSIKELKYFRVP